MDDRADAALTIVLYGTVRGKTVASIAHAYALNTLKLGLNPQTEHAPWRRPEGTKSVDYFTWRKALVEERTALRATLTGICGGSLLEPGAVNWPLVDGRSVYMAELAQNTAQDYARFVVKSLGLI